MADSDTNSSVDTVIQGSADRFLAPIPSHYLRTPHDKPQVCSGGGHERLLQSMCFSEDRAKSLRQYVPQAQHCAGQASFTQSYDAWIYV